MTSHAERNLQAEGRAVTEGHRAYLGGNGLLVVSDRIAGLHYLVHATSDGHRDVTFTCQPQADSTADLGSLASATHRYLRSEVPGHTPCKHAALAARRLERAGILAWDHGLWVLAPAEAARLAAEPSAADAAWAADPFKALGGQGR